jgi:hypothetical protein
MNGMGKNIAWPDTVGAKHLSPGSQPDTTHGTLVLNHDTAGFLRWMGWEKPSHGPTP